MNTRNCLTQRGLLGTFKYLVRGFLGIEKLQKEVDTAFYFLNEYIDPSSLPPTKDENLRLLQLCDTQLLVIFDCVCRKYGFRYWLDYGTLLGAVRHRGFIPWDDDMDISMPREDYNRFIENIPSEFSTYGFDVTVEPGRVGIGFKHQHTGIWLDVFPADKFYYSSEWTLVRKQLDNLYPQYRRSVLKNQDLAYSSVQKLFKKYFSHYFEGPDSFYFLSVDFFGNHRFYAVEEKVLYPLQTVQFEGISFPAPSCLQSYLTELYGESFFMLPRTGILQHGSASGRLPLSQWALQNGIDMKEILSYLKNVSQSIV